MAVMLVLEPIFEADLPPEQIAYRSGRSAHEVVEQVWEWLRHEGKNIVLTLRREAKQFDVPVALSPGR